MRLGGLGRVVFTVVFTVEYLDDEGNSTGHTLRESGRFCHTEDYVRRVLEEHGFVPRSIARHTLRHEGSDEVAGLVVAAERP